MSERWLFPLFISLYCFFFFHQTLSNIIKYLLLGYNTDLGTIPWEWRSADTPNPIGTGPTRDHTTNTDAGCVEDVKKQKSQKKIIDRICVYHHHYYYSV